MAEPFAYKPLEGEDEIRVLVVHAGDEFEAIVCRLEHVRLGEHPTFEAISYTWGDGFAEEPIIVDGRSVTIQLNLYLALKVFRCRDQTRTLWVDALCINQSDLEERSMQVNMMRDIYHASSTTLIWLGEEVDDDAAKASWSGWCSFYQRCYDLLRSTFDEYPSGEDQDHVWWRLLVCDLCKAGEEWSKASTGFAESDYLSADIASPIWQEKPGFSADKAMQGRQLRYYNTMSVTSAGMSFCCMEDGYAGWVPPLTQAGDRLCVFAGAGTPFVIRPSQNPGGDYQLIGDAYVHGVMHGEALAQ